MMNPWVKRKWVRALRSGEYEQGKRRLVTDYGDNNYHHCCLGVLACEMVPEFVRRKWAGANPSVDGKSGILPDDLAIHYGLGEDMQSCLTQMNDNGTSFPVIADWIDDNL